MNPPISFHRLQQISVIACFSTQFQKKNEAETYFTQFIKNIPIQLLTEILKSGSETLLFVTIQYLNKLIENYTIQQLQIIFNTVQTQTRNWYSTNDHQFIRTIYSNLLIDGGNKLNFQSPQRASKQLTNYVVNSISLFLSNSMKRFYLQENLQSRKQIVNWIGGVPNERYQLWLYKILIENISHIDSSMGFIKFRSLSYNFQQQVIPIIAQCLIPFLYKVEDIIKINEISSLQNNLNVQDQNINSLSTNNSIIFNSQREFRFAELIFDLLHSLVFYNYHLTYTQYEQESTFQNCLISFPEEFTSKVVTQQFMNSLGYVIERLIDLMPQSKFLKKTLQCLQKIFLTKLSFIDETKKVQFIKECSKVLTKNLSKVNLTPFIITKLMVCNNKFISNIQLSFFKQKKQLRQTFHSWIHTVTQTAFQLFQFIDLTEQFNFNLEQSVVIECLELYQKIVASFCAPGYYNFQLQESKSTNNEKQYIRKNVQIICEILIRKILKQQTKPLVHGSTAEIFKCNIFQMKTFCSSFFQPLRQLCSINYPLFFNQIEMNLQYSLNVTSPLNLKFNSFMLLSQIMDRNYLERNIISNKATDEQIMILSRCINKGLILLYSYMQNKPQHFIKDQQMILMDMSILIFLDKILSQFIGCFQNSDHQIEIKHKIFKNILIIQNKTSNSNQVSQDFILFCIRSVLSYLLIYNNTQETKHINQFIFDTINRILMKFKWSLKRDTFKNSAIYQNLSSFFSQISISTQIKINPQTENGDLRLFARFQEVKWRKKLIKIIALLYFDDVIDDYRHALNKIFQSLQNQHLLTIMLDIEGMGEAIDTSMIFKYYLEMINKHFTVERLTNEIVNLASYYNTYDKKSKNYPKIKIIKQVLRMHNSILCNKGQRLSNLKNLQGIYFMIKSLMGYWLNFLMIEQNEGWVPILKQILKIITELIKCDKINFYLLQRICLKQYLELFYLLFQKLQFHFDDMNEYPKLWDSFIHFMLNVSRELLLPIFLPTRSNSFKNLMLCSPQLKQKQNLIKQIFIRLFLLVFKKVGVYLEQIRASNKRNESNLDKCLQIIRFTLHFSSNKLNQHISHIIGINQLRQYFIQLKPLLLTQIRTVFKYLTLQKHYSVYKRNLILILYEAARIYPQLLEFLISDFPLPIYLVNQARECGEHIKKQELQLFVDMFKAWLRMLHMSEEEYQKNKIEQKQKYNFMSLI